MLYVCGLHDGERAIVLGHKCDNPAHSGQWLQEVIPGTVTITKDNLLAAYMESGFGIGDQAFEDLWDELTKNDCLSKK